VARISAAVLVVAVLASLVVLTVRAARGGGERSVVPIGPPGGASPATPAGTTTIPTTVAPTTAPTTAAPTTGARTTAPSTTVSRTTAASTSVAPTTTVARSTTVPSTAVASTTAVPTTTTPPTTAPPTSAPPATEAPTTPPPTTVPGTVAPAELPAATVIDAEEEPPDVQAALENARAIAAALADGDWAEARRLGPTDRSRTDAQLERGYGAVTDVTLLPARVTHRNGRTDLRLGLVAHEEHASGPATAVMCVHWRVNDASRAVQRISSVRLRLEDGIVDPATVADELRARCATYPLR
jgi:hypothetical protein